MSKHVFPLVLDGDAQTVTGSGDSWNGLTSYVKCTASADYTFTLSKASSEKLAAGTLITFVKTDATSNAITIDPSQDFDSDTPSVVLNTDGESCTFIWAGNETASGVAQWRLFSENQLSSSATFTGGSVADATTFANAVTITSGGLDLNGGDIDVADGTLHIEDGGAVTQATSRATGVTLNTHSGAITTDDASLADDAVATFAVACDEVGANDVVIVNHASGGSAGDIEYGVTAVGAGSFSITYKNVSGTASTDAYVFNFVVIHGANS